MTPYAAWGLRRRLFFLDVKPEPSARRRPPYIAMGKKKVFSRCKTRLTSSEADVGLTVDLRDLVLAAELNDQRGTILGWEAAEGRYAVELTEVSGTARHANECGARIGWSIGRTQNTSPLSICLDV